MGKFIEGEKLNIDGMEEFKNDICALMAEVVCKFEADLIEMAEENWCPSQIEMLKRLTTAVLSGERYDEVEME